MQEPVDHRAKWWFHPDPWKNPVIIQVNLDQGDVKVKVECDTISGTLMCESMEDSESLTWQDLAAKLFLLKKEKFHYVKFVNEDGESVPRS